jgi:DNA-binding NarL/FixJ family response regulator
VKGSVLLVEDERDTRELLGRALERAGYRAACVENADQALARAKAEGPFDVVVTDIVIGSDDRQGLRLLSELRSLGVRSPVIVITAHADVEKVKVALNEGAQHLLEKPFRTEELVRAIERVSARGGGLGDAEEIFSRAELTDKERTVARLLLSGLSSSEIAVLERNSPKTIRQHVSQIYAKCGVGNRASFFRLLYGGDG